MVFLHRGFSETAALTGNRMPESVVWLKYLIAPMHPSGIHLFRWCLRINLDSSAWAVVGRRHIDRSHILLFGEYSKEDKCTPVQPSTYCAVCFVRLRRLLEVVGRQGAGDLSGKALHSNKTGGRKRFPFVFNVSICFQTDVDVSEGIRNLDSIVRTSRHLKNNTNVLPYLFIDGLLRFPITVFFPPSGDRHESPTCLQINNDNEN